jgi:hypothetical protein
MARPLAAALGALAVLALSAGPAAAATERVRLTLTQVGSNPGAGAAFQVYASNGLNLGCYASFTSATTCTNDIAGTHVSVSGTTVAFYDDIEPSTRCFRVRANDTDGPTNTPNTPVSVRATLTDPDGTRQDLGPFQMSNGGRIYVGSTPAEAGLIPGSAVEYFDQCTDNFGVDGDDDKNHRPVARRDSWSVKAGWAADENLLENDYDPDGDRITARVTKISFAKKEWTGADRDGGFLYTAGPGTRRTLRKKITYHVVDSRGARSKSVTSIVTVKPQKRAKRKPMASANAPYWSGPWGRWFRLCFGSGLDSQCFTMLSVRQTQLLNQERKWTNLDGALQWCLKYGVIPMKNKDCAKKLVDQSFVYVWDKSVINNAAKLGNCLMFQTERNRTLRHPRAGEWTKPIYRTLDSLVKPYNGNARVSGWGTWGKWRVPLVCENNGLVYGRVWQSLVPKP